MYRYIYMVILTIILIISIYHKKGGIEMNAEIIAALIGASVIVIGDIIKSIRDSKKFENILNEKFNDISKKLGTENYKNRSLSLQHENICDLVENKSEVELNAINNYGEFIGEIITDINERGKKEAYQKEEREKYLTPEMLEIKNVLAAVTNQNNWLNDMKVELEKVKQENNQLRAEITRLKSTFDSNACPDFTQTQNCGRK